MRHVPAQTRIPHEVQLHPDLTLILPAYNEAQRLPGTLAAIKAELDGWNLDYRVLVVDDGSRDGTWQVLEDFDPRFSCWRMPQNSGKGAAVRAGMLQATGDVVAFTDADLPFDLAALKTAKTWIENGQCDVVCGDRTASPAGHEGGQASSWMRWLSGLIFRQLVWWIVAPAVKDTQCGLKVFSRAAARDIFRHVEAQGFTFDVEVICRTQRLGYTIQTVPVQLVNTAGSTISLWRHTWPMVKELFAIRRRLRSAMTDSAQESPPLTQRAA